jgi:8-oxo-dGTP pyrophosphatase MutT (NUDIX family)
MSYLQTLRPKVGQELLLMISVAVIVYDEAGRVLLVRHSEGDVWVAPGGSIEPPETLADAAVREMWEETGLWVEPVRVLGVYGGPEFLVTYRNGDQVSYQIMVFEGRVIGGSLQPDGDETQEVAYVSQTELADLKIPPWMRVVMPDVFARQRYTAFRRPTWQPAAGAVRKGGISDYGRHLRQLVGNTQIVTPCVVGWVFDEQGRILLQRRIDNGRWSGPGGAIDPHEAPVDAMVREAWEETGVLVEPVRVLEVFGGATYAHTFPGGDQIINYGAIFACRLVGGTPSPDGIESSAVEFFPMNALPMAEMSPRWQQGLARLQAQPNGASFAPPSLHPTT